MGYDVYGIGNALLDIQFDVDFNFLEQNNIAKGLMTNIEHDAQTQLIEKIGREKIRQISSGGSVANSMMVMQYFGGKGFYSCKISNDEAGDQYYHEMKSAGLDTNFDSHPRPEGNTGRCVVNITPDADRTMSTYLGISTELSEKELDHEALAASEYLYIEGYLAASPSALIAVKKAKEIAEKNKVKTAITLSDPAIVAAFRNQFLDIIGDGVDLIFCNEAEAMKFTQTTSLQAAEKALLKYTKTYVITIGPKGSLVYDGNQLMTVPATEEKPIDTLGAGDMYAGAFLYAITKGMPWRMAGELANLTSSRVVTLHGPRINPEDTKLLLNQLAEKQVEAA